MPYRRPPIQQRHRQQPRRRQPQPNAAHRTHPPSVAQPAPDRRRQYVARRHRRQHYPQRHRPPPQSVRNVKGKDKPDGKLRKMPQKHRRHRRLKPRQTQQRPRQHRRRRPPFHPYQSDQQRRRRRQQRHHRRRPPSDRLPQPQPNHQTNHHRQRQRRPRQIKPPRLTRLAGPRCCGIAGSRRRRSSAASRRRQRPDNQRRRRQRYAPGVNRRPVKSRHQRPRRQRGCHHPQRQTGRSETHAQPPPPLREHRRRNRRRRTVQTPRANRLHYPKPHHYRQRRRQRQARHRRRIGCRPKYVHRPQPEPVGKSARPQRQPGPRRNEHHNNPLDGGQIGVKGIAHRRQGHIHRKIQRRQHHPQPGGHCHQHDAPAGPPPPRAAGLRCGCHGRRHGSQPPPTLSAAPPYPDRSNRLTGNAAPTRRPSLRYRAAVAILVRNDAAPAPAPARIRHTEER